MEEPTNIQYVVLETADEYGTAKVTYIAKEITFIKMWIIVSKVERLMAICWQ